MHADGDDRVARSGRDARLVCVDLQRSSRLLLSNAEGRWARRYSATDASGSGDEGSWDSNDSCLFAAKHGLAASAILEPGKAVCLKSYGCEESRHWKPRTIFCGNPTTR